MEEPAGRYFTVQNLHDPASGALDYSVTLLDFARPDAATAAIPLSNDTSLLLGRITLQGVADGRLDIIPADPSESPSQFVLLDRRGRTTTVQPSESSLLLASVRVGNDAAAGGIQGQVTSEYPEDLQQSSWLPMPVNVSFWETGAVPPWRRGAAAPLAAFFGLTTDSQGRFSVTDISPLLLPAGIYDVRVWGPGALPGLAPRVVIPAPGDSSRPVPPGRILLRWGDTDGNHVVDQDDLSGLKAAFGRLSGTPGYAEVTDLNRDRVIDGLDFSLMAQNLGKRGQ